MTAIERIMQIVNAEHDMEADTVEKLVTIAYYMGRESATREVSDMYNAHIAKQKERAEACRYSNMAKAVVGAENYLYSPDYAGDFTATFGSDETEL